MEPTGIRSRLDDEANVVFPQEVGEEDIVACKQYINQSINVIWLICQHYMSKSSYPIYIVTYYIKLLLGTYSR